jgi:hypothetical protein
MPPNQLGAAPSRTGPPIDHASAALIAPSPMLVAGPAAATIASARDDGSANNPKVTRTDQRAYAGTPHQRPARAIRAFSRGSRGGATRAGWRNPKTY